METIEILNSEQQPEMLFSHTCKDNTIRKTLEVAISNCFDLSGANLKGVTLSHAYLTGAQIEYGDLSDSTLKGAYLSDSDLRHANLSGADLTGADLNDSDLSGANLSGADLTDASLYNTTLFRANLAGANLTGANLTGASLDSVNLREANLLRIREDFYRVLDNAKPEIGGLRQALIWGSIDGRMYEGDCACLVGTIAKLRNEDYEELEGITPNDTSPIERWFLGIRKGDNPATNQISAIVVEWIDQYLQKELV
jgi:hypothetical protein